MKKGLLFICLLVQVFLLKAVVYTYSTDFGTATSGTPPSPFVTGTSTPAAVSITGWTGGNIFFGGVSGGAYCRNLSNGNGTITLTLVVPSGSILDITGFGWDGRRTSTGPSVVAVDVIGTAFSVTGAPGNGSFAPISASGSATGLTGTVTINIAYSGGSGMSQNIRMDNFSITAAVLPLELTSFSAKKSSNKNDLAWQTATETNVSHFDIQRSSDGQTWQSIGEVKAVGNTRDVQNYDFSDEKPLQTSYYRLRSVDFDGAEQLSGVERVVRQSSVKSAYVLPTSVQDQATVVVDSDIETETSLTIFDQTGRQISTQNASLGKGENRIALEVNNLPQGIYTIRFGQNEAEPLRFVKK